MFMFVGERERERKRERERERERDRQIARLLLSTESKDLRDSPTDLQGTLSLVLHVTLAVSFFIRHSPLESRKKVFISPAILQVGGSLGKSVF
jgi:hypothetical protein